MNRHTRHLALIAFVGGENKTRCPERERREYAGPGESAGRTDSCSSNAIEIIQHSWKMEYTKEKEVFDGSNDDGQLGIFFACRIACFRCKKVDSGR